MNIAALNVLRFVSNHPLNSGKKLRAVRRVMAWQLASRLLSGPTIVPYVNGSRLIVDRGMNGATGNLYTGLFEFEHMAFVLHSLRPGDLFVDVGANIGSYTILASAVAGAACISLEPIPSTFSRLLDNLNLNRVGARVDARNIGIARSPGKLRFTASLDCTNHVLADGQISEDNTSVQVAVDSLDNVLGERKPALIKIDVEGYEAEVIAGAERTLGEKELAALIVEVSWVTAPETKEQRGLNETILAHGFKACNYLPFKRRLIPLEKGSGPFGNILYVRDFARVRERLETAPIFQGDGWTI